MARLKELHGEGKSFSQIVQALNKEFPNRKPSFRVAAVSQKAACEGLSQCDCSGYVKGAASASPVEVQKTPPAAASEDGPWTDDVREFIQSLPVRSMSPAEGLEQVCAEFPDREFTSMGLIQVVRYMGLAFKPSSQLVTAADAARTLRREALDRESLEGGLIGLHELTERKCKCRLVIQVIQPLVFVVRLSASAQVAKKLRTVPSIRKLLFRVRLNSREHGDRPEVEDLWERRENPPFSLPEN